MDEKLFVRIGDFLLSRANTLELVGTCAIARKVRRQVMLSDKILRLRLAIDETQWPLLMLRSPWGRSQIQAGSSGNQLSMRNIGQAAIRRIALPLPPSEEVGMLLERSASGLEVGDSLASLVESARRALPSLERATLNEAFSGKLR